MKKYAIILNDETKICAIGIGDDVDTYKELGMVEMDVEQAYDGNWYVEGYAPEKPAPTYEEVDKAREEYRKEHIDSKTAMRSRKMANGTWTEKDEQGYLDLDKEVTSWIEENLPYPDSGSI